MYTLTISTLNSNVIAMWTAVAGRGRTATAEDVVLLSITLNVIQQYDPCRLCPVQRGTSITGYKCTSDTEIHITHTWWHNGRSYDTHNDSCWVIDSQRDTQTQAHRHRFTHTDMHTQRHLHMTPVVIWNWCCSFDIFSYETVVWLPSSSCAMVLKLTSKGLETFSSCLLHTCETAWYNTHTYITHPPTHTDHQSPTQHRRQIDRRRRCWAVTSICHTPWTTHHHRTPAVGLHILCCRQRVVQRVWMWCLHRYKKGTNVQSASTHHMIFWLSHHLENGSRSLKLVWMCKVNVIVMKSFKHLLKQHPW